MTEKETLELLDEISAAYPLFLKDRDAKRAARIWKECLRDADFPKAHDALIEYCRRDNRNLPPAPGNILDLMEDPLMPKDHVYYEPEWDDDLIEKWANGNT